MRRAGRLIPVLVLAAALAGCGGESSQQQAGGQQSGEQQAAAGSEGAESPSPAAADAAPPAFVQCRACHSVVAGQNMIGPSLHGIVGARAASQPGFDYSPALKASGLTWDEATLEKWLQGPSMLVPGTRMMLPPIADAARRKQIVDYLATLK